jgi:thioester reductase-like protein
VAIVDPDRGQPLPDGQVGEVWVAGASKCLGYWDRPEATRETFQAEIAGGDGRQHLRTGDMGFIHQGELYVCGRRKDMLIVRGQNIYPQDVEAVVEQVPGVRRSGVAAVEARGGEVVILAEASSLRTRPNLDEVIQRVRARLNLESGRVVLLAPRSLPKTSSGKLMRQRSRQLWETGGFQVLGEEVRVRASDDEALATTADAPFGFFKAKYRLSGEETQSLTDAGLDSLDLVLLMHEFSELLTRHGANELAEQVDIRLVQQMSIAELFRLVGRFEDAPETAVAQVRRSLATLDEARRSEEDRMMSADRRLSFQPSPQDQDARVYPPRAILLTGATGFLGPFLLTSLLEQTSAHIYTLVRGADAASATERLRRAVGETSRRDAEFWRTFERRVSVVCGDLDAPDLGLPADLWSELADAVDTIYHNGAMVNYLFSYKRMRAANVGGTNEVLKLAFAGRRKVFNYVSTTFIYGWATKDVLYESDANDGMELLDFGYSQSKWTAEQVVIDAMRMGLGARIFRPALITPAVNGDGASYDITLRLLAFMIKYGVGVDALNQVSFMPADVTANNIVAISNLERTEGGTFHVTRDDYANMIDVTNIITQLTGRTFEPFDLPSFVPEVIKRCTREDLLFPLLDFLVGSIDNISSMEFKRYDSSEYQRARSLTAWGRPDPSMEDTVAGMLRFMQRTGLVELSRAALAELDAA